MKRSMLTILFIALLILGTACARSTQSTIEVTTIPAETTAAPTPTPEPTLSIDEKASTYPEGDYEDYARNPDTYTFQNVQITGEVIQVVEGDVIIYRIITDDSYDQVWYIEYEPVPGESRILEEDTVTVYGIYYGIYSYESVMGGTISVPAIIAENVVLH